MTALETLKEEAAKIEVVMELFNNKVKDLITIALQETVFSKYPDQITYVSISNYVPYFCDGDPCQFTVGNISVLLVDEEIEYNQDYCDEDQDEDEALSDESQALSEEIINLAAEVFYTIPSNTWEEMFGANISVQFLADGTITTEDFEPPY